MYKSGQHTAASCKSSFNLIDKNKAVCLSTFSTQLIDKTSTKCLENFHNELMLITTANSERDAAAA